MFVQKCSNGHFNFETEVIKECGRCDSKELHIIDSPNELMEIAEGKADREYAHRFADASLLTRIKEVDPHLYERYEKLRKKGFWYA